VTHTSAGAVVSLRAPLSLYIHIPFCRVRCAYCDFNTYAGLDGLMPAYTKSLVMELCGVAAASQHGDEVHTIFFGGGTPSLLPLPHYQHILGAIRNAFSLSSDCEITLEANPGTVDAGYVHGLRELGVNRLSLGVQSSHAAELQLLDRLHSFDDVVQAVRLARTAGFNATRLSENDARPCYGLNLDLIFALPHQTMSMWQSTLQRVLALDPDHLSLYALSLENGTPLRSWVYRGLLPMPDPDLAADMYHWAAETLAASGYQQYEISNWARGYTPAASNGSTRVAAPAETTWPLATGLPALHCRHNVQYWRNGPYLGFGAGAHGSLPGSWLEQGDTPSRGWRYSNVLAPAAYIGRFNASDMPAMEPFPFSPATIQRTAVDPQVERDETMMLGLRLTGAGVVADEFRRRFGLALSDAYPRQLRRLRDLRLIDWDERGARLTPGGLLLANRVFREFV
jgi:oxygen-independent coproporphyrinogen III oxidase